MPPDRRRRHRAATPPRQLLIVSAAIVLVLALTVEPWGAAVGFIPFALVAPALAWIDLHEHLLPRRLSRAGSAAGFISLSLVALVIGDTGRIASMIAGALIALALIGMLYAVGRGLGAQGAIGLGDVHLAPLLGVNLGWFGSRTVFGGLVLGWILVGVASALLLALRRVDRSSDVALGPSLLAGAFIAMALAG
jgi:leader peptidase (prepilin peptidase) / N-methyltransferase